MLVMICVLFMSLFGNSNDAPGSTSDPIEYRLLAANKISPMEKEMNNVAAEGFRFEGVVGREIAGGVAEVVVIMSRMPAAKGPRYDYKLLATNKTSTMQKELSAAGEAGFLYAGQTINDSTIGGRKVVIILERSDGEKAIYEYKLLGTTLPSTMQKEISEAGRAGFLFSGITVAESDYGRREVVSILQRRVAFANSGTTILR